MGGRDVQNGLKLPQGVQLTGGNRGNLQIYFMYRGIQCRENLKLKPTKGNIKYATILRDGILSEIARGIFDYPKQFPNSKRVIMFGGAKQTKITVEEALQNYLAHKKRTTAPSTWNDYLSSIRHHLIPTFGSVEIKQLSTGQVRVWIGSLLISNKRINNVLVPLRGMLKDAFADGLIDRDPMDRVKNLPVRTREPEPFSKDERRRILQAMKSIGHPQAANLIQFAFWTGLRTSELLALDWKDIDFTNSIVMVRRANVRGGTKEKETKTAAGERDVILFSPAKEALLNQKLFSFVEGGHVFRRDWDNEPWINDNQISKRVWILALRKAGVIHRGIYQTRHTYASNMLSIGENPAWIAKQMGHVNMGTLLDRYARWIPDDDQARRLRVEKLIAAEK